ncbi:MAG: MATE family efflux transporter [Lysobacterales bacterium]
MHDLTQGSIFRHLIRLALPIAVGMVFQTLYVLVDLYFVARLGDTAIAGVSAAGNAQFLVMALTQVLGVGTMALIAQAAGRRDRDDANRIFNQSLVLALGCALLTLLFGYGLTGWYMHEIGADQQTAVAGKTYLFTFLPGLALQFALVTMGSALRGTGIAKPTMVVQLLTVLLNALLAPILIAGWLTGKPLGVAGAGLATSLSIAAGVAMMTWYFARLESYVGLDRRELRPQWAQWRRILAIGLPPGGEFALMFLYLGVIYAVIGSFGAAAQAGFGVGSRVMQAIFLPAIALAFACSPIAAQNVGAGQPDRVREVFRTAAWAGSAVMLVLTLICQWRPGWFITGFTDEPDVVAIGGQFLRIISWNFVASGLIFTCSGMFQALGNTLPALMSSASRLFTFVLPVLWVSAQPGFSLRQVWFVSVASVAMQALLSLWLLRREMSRRLQGLSVDSATLTASA